MKKRKIILFYLAFITFFTVINTIYGSTKIKGISNFPENYKPYLQELSKRHPNWSFTALYTGLDWNTVIDNEVILGKSLVPKNYSDSWKNTDTDIYNVEVDAGWVNASRRAVEYTMDPRNFLNEIRIFGYEELSYDPDVNTKVGIENILYGTEFYNKFVMEKQYSDLILDAAITSNVSAYLLASRIKQEVGPFLSHLSISGTFPGYEGLYNFYNIGATSSPEPLGAIKNGLQYSKDGKGTTQDTKDKYLIPWTDQAKSITGGAIFIGSSYINVGQNTLYLQKFDVNDERSSTLFWHQYMTNILAPYNESRSIYTAYLNSNMLDTSMNFIIPVYNNMPDLQTQSPNISDSDYIIDNSRVYANVTGTVNIMSGPSITNEVLTKVTKDDILIRIGKGVQSGELWDKVILPSGMFGYIYQGYLEEIPSEVIEITEDILVSDVIIDKDNLIILKGNTATLIAKIVPENATNKNILFESDDNTIATVDESGIVTGIGKGVTQIRVISEDGRITKTCEIIVNELEEDTGYTFLDDLKVDGDKISGFDINDLFVGSIKEKISINNTTAFIYNIEGIELGDEDTVGTGSKIVIKNDVNEILTEYTIIIYGDVDGDGQITSIDLLKLQRHILEISLLDPEFELSGDTSKEGVIPTSIDLLKIQRHILELKSLEQ